MCCCSNDKLKRHLYTQTYSHNRTICNLLHSKKREGRAERTTVLIRFVPVRCLGGGVIDLEGAETVLVLFKGSHLLLLHRVYLIKAAAAGDLSSIQHPLRPPRPPRPRRGRRRDVDGSHGGTTDGSHCSAAGTFKPRSCRCRSHGVDLRSVGEETSSPPQN